jgi:hypothetical protein
MSTAFTSARRTRLVATGLRADEVAIALCEAAEVLRPRAIGGRVDDEAPDLPGSKLLRFGREPEDRIDLTLDELLLGVRGEHDLQVLSRVEADIARHGGDKRVTPLRRDRDRPTPEVQDRTHLGGPK